MNTCPQCGGRLISTGHGPGWMNEEQWDAVKAGDYYCMVCTDPDTESGHKYFWKSDLVVIVPGHNED